MSSPPERDLVVVGAGPAGLAAALAGGEAGIRALVIDDRAQPGGQVYRQPPVEFTVGSERAIGPELGTGRALLRRVRAEQVEIRSDTTVWDIQPPRLALAAGGPASAGEAQTISARHIVLATGAYDRPVAVPGWTLPGVLTAGGADALVKSQNVLPGRRVVMCGVGPLLLAFSVQLHRAGCELVAVVDLAPRLGVRDVLRFARVAPGNTGTLLAGAGYLAYLARHRIPVLHRHVITAVLGAQRAAAVMVSRVDAGDRVVPHTSQTLAADVVCLGYGFTPSTELARLAGCAMTYSPALGCPVPVRDKWLQTSVRGVYAVGDGADIGGSALALAEGRLVGLRVAQALGAPTDIRSTAAARRRLSRLRRLSAVVGRTFPVSPALDELATGETVICRCEDVTLDAIVSCVRADGADANGVKALTRAGMGPCQGRNCGARVARIVAAQTGQAPAQAQPWTARPPARPVPLGALARPIAPAGGGPAGPEPGAAAG